VAQVEYVLIGGLAVSAHGAVRTTKDVDICPSPAPANLGRLAAFLATLGVRQLGVEKGGLSADEMPYDPTRVEDLAVGGNFRLETPLGILDVMQWIPGIDSDHAYATLAAQADSTNAFGIVVRVCSLEHLLTMKRTAGRPIDLQDIADLEAAQMDSN
jgi:hypothetical protein